MSIESEAKIERLVRENSVDGRLSCKKALEIANRLNVAPRRVGDAANNLKIKLSSCQLGCFK